MTRGPIADFADRINARDRPRGVLAIAGGGTEALPMLLARGGGSATLLSARVPYDPADFRLLVGPDPGRLVDPRAARSLAMASFRHALRLRGDLPPDAVFGLGSTSKLIRASGERAGRAHEVHLALQTSTRTVLQSLALPPGGDRAWQERINAFLILNLIGRAKGVEGAIPLDCRGRSVDPAALVEVAADASNCGHSGLPALLEGRSPSVAFRLGGGEPVADEGVDPPRLLLPGSFRPLHDGHARMAALASALEGAPCAFEVSVTHPEKPPLDYLEIAERLRGFVGRSGRLFLTDAPTYRDKARIFPGCTFVVGHDTALRIIDPRYYGGIAARDAMLAELEALGTRLLVFGRVDATGRFRDLAAEGVEDPVVAGFLARNARAVPEADFRVDLSSTLLRGLSGADLP